MYDYNTSREPMRLRQFGRNMQNLARYVASLESKEERNKYATAMVELMKQIVPSVKVNQESSQMLWDDLHFLANFDIDIDSPFPSPENKMLDSKPGKIGYVQGNIPFRHYGRNVIRMIETAKEIDNAEEQEVAVFQIARLIKTFHIAWNRETPENELIAKNINKLSGGVLNLNLEKAIELDLLDPLYKDKPRPSNQKPSKSGKSGKHQNRRRR